jgi:hypothetical protein
MNINELLEQSRNIWPKKCNIGEIIIRMGKVFGDICRYARNEKKDQALHNDQEIKKELGNMIVSSIKWCDDLGYNPEECINLAIEAQKNYPKE